MQMLWCWRCKAEMPMLDGDEYAEALRLHGEAIRATGDFRQRNNVSLKEASVEQRFKPLLLWYEKRTGIEESNHRAIMHHCLSLYGPPCKQCGRPLRTPKAKLCGVCMFPVDFGEKPYRPTEVDLRPDFRINS